MIYGDEYTPIYNGNNYSNYDALEDDYKQIVDFLHEHVFCSFSNGEYFEYKTVDDLAAEIRREAEADYYNYDERKYIHFFNTTYSDNFMDLIERLTPIFRTEGLRGRQFIELTSAIEDHHRELTA